MATVIEHRPAFGAEAGTLRRCAIYARVSTDDQATAGYSLQAQLARLRDYAKARDWEIQGEYVDDGYSGRNTKRPAYREMMTAAPQWDILLCLKMDRIHRNSRNFIDMMDELHRAGKEFASVMESLDTSTAMGRFVVDIIQRIAQLESEQIGERVYAGMLQKARTPIVDLSEAQGEDGGPYLGSNTPYGYEYDPRDHAYMVLDAEATVVRRIYEAYNGGATLQAIADALNAEGILGKEGGRWFPKQISYLLKNPLYAGHVRWGDPAKAVVVKPAPHGAIVSKEVFNLAQEVRSRRPKGQKEGLRL